MPAKSREAVLTQGRSLLLLMAFVCASGVTSPARAQSQVQASTREFRASRTDKPPVIDGQLSDEVWSRTQVMSDFTQVDPDEGQPATERTEVRVLYRSEERRVGKSVDVGGRRSIRNKKIE